MHRQRIALLVIALVGMIGTFLPWINVLGASCNGTVGDGWITLGLYAPVVLMALVGSWKKSWQGAWFIALAIPSLLASAVGVYDIANFYIKLGPLAQLCTVGVGLYLVAAAGVALVFFALILQWPGHREIRRSAPAVTTAA